jgi:integrase
MKAFVFQPSRNGAKSRLWSARVRLGDWLNSRTFPLHVTDKRVAEQKLEKLVQELEREAEGIIAPKLMRDSAQTTIAAHLTAFLADLEAKGRAKNTLGKYRNCIPSLCKRCKWVMVRDITSLSFTAWRAKSSLRPKTHNDLLGAMSSLLNWMERQQLILSNPLKHVERVHDRSPREFRRALLPEDAQRLLNVAPLHRATVYLMILYTGLRKCELRGLIWEDFNFEANPPCVRVSGSISKNGHSTTHGLRPELVSALKAFRPVNAMPFEWVFRGVVPRVPTFKKDLAAAKIPFVDEKGRRMDIHALRKSFGTMLAVSGVSLRVGMELMRHSESRLTEKVYTDASHLPLQPALDGLPSLSVHRNDSPPDAPAGGFSGRYESLPVTSSHFAPISQITVHGTLGHKKAPCVTTGRLSEMERAKRLELSTSTLARWCSTN